MQTEKPTPGHRLTIFNDPYTRQRVEGVATVIRVLRHEANPYEGDEYRLRVRFDGDRETFDRTWVGDPAEVA